MQISTYTEPLNAITLLYIFIKDWGNALTSNKISKNGSLQETGLGYDQNFFLLRQYQTKCLEQSKEIY